MPSIQQKREALVHKTFVMAFQILFIFGIPALAAYITGRWIQSTYQTGIYGLLAPLGIAFVFSWVLVIRVYLQITKEFAMLREEEEVERASEQARITKQMNSKTQSDD